MKIKIIYLLTCILVSLVCLSCSKETIEPNLIGSIKGQIRNNDTGDPVTSASITTNPGTDAVLTDSAGSFEINDVPTGNLTLQVEKDGFESKTVRLAVNEDKETSVNILLNTRGNNPADEFLDAQVTSFVNTSRNDSSFTEINYLITNNSNDQMVLNYEVTFKIFTSGSTFFTQINGDSLDAGEQDVGEAIKFIRQATADSVTVSNIYAPNPG